MSNPGLRSGLLGSSSGGRILLGAGKRLHGDCRSGRAAARRPGGGLGGNIPEDVVEGAKQGAAPCSSGGRGGGAGGAAQRGGAGRAKL